MATTFSHASDNVQKGRAGTLIVESSRNEAPRPASSAPHAAEEDDCDAGTTPPAPKKKDANREFELAHNFQSSVERSRLVFNAPADWTWDDRNRLPYPYEVEPVGSVEASVSRFAGTGHLRDADMVPPP